MMRDRAHRLVRVDAPRSKYFASQTRRMSYAILALFPSFSSICLLLLFIVGGAQADSQAGLITRFAGQVKVINANGVEPARDQMPLSTTDKILTESDGRVEITFRDGTVFTLGTSTTIEIKHYLYVAGSHGHLEGFLKRGRLQMTSGSLALLDPDQISISSDFGHVKLTGKETSIWCETGEGTFTVVLLGGPDVTIGIAQNALTLTGANAAATAAADSGTISPQRALNLNELRAVTASIAWP